MSAPRELWICHLDTLRYADGVALQERLRAARLAEEIPDVLLLLEHWPVYTRGRRSGPGDLPMGAEWYELQGIEVADTNRGGKVTYHGPGQLVGYPIMRTGDVLAHVRTLELAIVAALAHEGLPGRARVAEGPDFTGVWIGERKVASIGVHVARGITTHGFAINVENDLQPFQWIVPCGLEGVSMTSVRREHGTATLADFRLTVAGCVAEAFGLPFRALASAELGIGAPVGGVGAPVTQRRAARR